MSKTFARLRSNDLAKEKLHTLRRLNDSEVEVPAQSAIFKFDQVFTEEMDQKDLFENLVRERLETDFIHKKDCLFITIGSKNSGSSYTMFGDNKTLSIDGNVGRSLHFIFDKIGSDNLCSFKTLSKHLGNSLIKSGTGKENAGSYGLTMSIFDLHDDSIRDILTNKEIPLKSSTNLARDVKDGKIRPAGLSQFYLSNFEHSIELVKTALQRKKNSKRPYAHCIVQINLHEIKKFNRIQSTRLTFLKISTEYQDASQRRLPTANDCSLSEFSKILVSMKAGQFQSSLLKTSKLNKLLFSDMIMLKNFNISLLVSLDPCGDEATVMSTLHILFPKENSTRTGEVIQIPTISTTSLAVQLEKLKLEILEMRNKNVVLESENRELTGNLLTIEQETRLNVSNRYEQMIEEMNRDNISSRFDDDETYQVTTDAKLESLALHYDSKVDKIRSENSKLKLQLESVIYQNNSMDKLFHVELTKLSDELREEYELKYAEELQKSVNDKNAMHLLQETNDILGQKVKLLESQVNVLKEKAGRETEEAEQMYNKIKSLRLNDEVLMLINEKLKSQLGKEKKSKSLKRISTKRRSGSPLVDLSSDPNNFKIFEDQPKDSSRVSKKKLSKRNERLNTDNSDVEMV